MPVDQLKKLSGLRRTAQKLIFNLQQSMTLFLTMGWVNLAIGSPGAIFVTNSQTSSICIPSPFCDDRCNSFPNFVGFWEQVKSGICIAQPNDYCCMSILFLTGFVSSSHSSYHTSVIILLTMLKPTLRWCRLLSLGVLDDELTAVSTISPFGKQFDAWYGVSFFGSRFRASDRWPQTFVSMTRFETKINWPNSFHFTILA